jgi:uncharacterized protein
MARRRISIAAVLLIASALASIAQAQQKGYPITPVPFTAVAVNDAFWGPRLEINRTVTIPYAFKQCEETGRVRNFDLADSVLAGTLSKGTFCSRYGFDDSDLYKIIEGAAYSLHTRYDAALDAYLDGLITKIALAQEKDGYLYTMRTIDPEKSWAKQRWMNDRANGSHELYNMGHLYEAAVAHFSATGKRSLLAIALKNADMLCETFGPARMHTVPGHQVIEIGLAKLYLVTGEKKYLDLAKFFLDERGKPKGETYNQDHLPVVEQSEAVGHAVRAAYMYSGMADVAALTGDESYVRAIDRIWDDVVEGKLYLTGGIGAAGSIEGFGAKFELPNLSAYCETCASIANVFWNFRMFLRHGDARYLDIVERVIYNGFLSGVSMKGDRFFYPNPLESFKSHERSPWFACACCPSNIVRFIPSIPGYMYAHRADTVYVNLFISGRAELKIDGNPVTFSQQSNYPWEGNVAIAVSPGLPQRFTVAVRIPEWARGVPLPGGLYRYLDATGSHYSVSVGGKEVQTRLANGFMKITRQWNEGDTIHLSMAMPVRRVVARKEVEDDRGRAALERGPLVYCLEGTDVPDGHVLSLVVPDTGRVQTSFEKNLLGGVQTIRGRAMSARRTLAGEVTVDQGHDFKAIPYYAWAHRGQAEMTVWTAREPVAAKPLPAPTIAFSSKLTTSGGEGADALKDQLLPRNSNDPNIPYFHWWPKKGTTEWVQYEFGKKETVRNVSVYWFDDTGSGECRVPRTWKILYRSGGEWKAIEDAVCGVQKDRRNDVAFTPVETDGLRLEIQLQEGFSAGLYEWSVN